MRDQQPAKRGSRSVPAPTGWLSTREAAERLGLGLPSVVRLVLAGQLEGQDRAGRWWVTVASVEQLQGERSRWVSLVDAAELARCAPGTVAAAADAGEIAQRRGSRAMASLDRASVLAWAEQRAAAEDERAAARAAREAERAARRPPRDGDVWLDATTAAAVLGLSVSGVRWLAGDDRLPHVRRSGRLWFRRRDVEQVAAARAFRARWGRPPTSGQE